MNTCIIDKYLSQKILMTGVYYKNNHPGGISAVVQYWAEYIENLQYYPEFKEGSNVGKIWIFVTTLFSLFFRLLCDRSIKIVHIHTADYTDFRRNSFIISLAKLFRKKIVLHSHGATFVEFYSNSGQKKKFWILRILDKADVVIVLSESWKQWFMSIGVSEGKLVILHNITAYPQVMQVEKSEKKIRLLFLGEIGERKGVFDLLRALSLHKEELKDIVELHIGGNKMEEELKTAIWEGGLEKNVFFDGFVAGETKIRLLNWANVFILPSFNEGLPISILEAMSYRLPIISTPVGGIPEVVDETNGILITPGDEEQIYQAIKKYVDHIELLDEHGTNSYKKAETYLPDYVLCHLKSIYEGLLID